MRMKKQMKRLVKSTLSIIMNDTVVVVDSTIVATIIPIIPDQLFEIPIKPARIIMRHLHPWSNT